MKTPECSDINDRNGVVARHTIRAVTVLDRDHSYDFLNDGNPRSCVECTLTECVEVRKYNVVTNHGIKVLESFNCFSGQALSIDEIEVVRDRLRILLRQSDNARLALLSFFLESGVKECGIFSQHVSVNHHLMFVGPNDKSD
jgi:hypothetical protein